MPVELKLSPLRTGHLSTGIGVPQLRKGAMLSWEHRPLRRGCLFAGANVSDDSMMQLFVQALEKLPTGFICCGKNKVRLLR